MIYISGKITGTDDYLYKFHKAEVQIGRSDIINPARVNSQLPKNTTYKQYMKMSLCMLEMCDTIYMLKGWEDSQGARLEHEYAKVNGYLILYQEDD